LEASAGLIPNFIKAKSEIGLRRLMLEINLKNQAMHKFFDIQYVNGYWYAWFYQEYNLQGEVEAKIKKGE